jgi:hypothetical protein
VQVIEPDPERADRLMKVAKATHCADAVQVIRCKWSEYTPPATPGLLLIPPDTVFPTSLTDVDSRFAGKSVAVLSLIEHLPEAGTTRADRRWELFQGKTKYLLERFDRSLRPPGA